MHGRVINLKLPQLQRYEYGYRGSTGQLGSLRIQWSNRLDPWAGGQGAALAGCSTVVQGRLGAKWCKLVAPMTA